MIKILKYPFILLWVDLLINYAVILIKKRKFDKSMRILNKAAEYGIRKTLVYNNIAFINLVEYKNYEEAEKALEIAIKEKPKHCVTLVNLSYLYIKLGEYGKALEMTDRLMKSWCYKTLGYNNRAVVFIRLKKYDLALEAIKKATKGYFFQNNIYYNKSLIEERMGNFEEALKSMKKAIKKGGKKYCYKYLLAKIYAEKGDFENSLNILKLACKEKDAYVFDEDIKDWQAIDNEEIQEIINSLPLKSWKEI